MNFPTTVRDAFTCKTPIVSEDGEVYEPAEDSFLLLDALEQDLTELHYTLNFSPNLCLEVGCGSGIVSAGLLGCNYFRKHVPTVLAMDINPAACFQSRRTALENKSGTIESILGNGLDSSLMLRCSFDLILCNPPYVPSRSDDFDEGVHPLLKASWDGGIDGNQFILPFLKVIPELLNESGKAYLLLTSFNKPQELMENVVPGLGLKSRLVLKRSAGSERLSVWRLERV